MGQPPAAARCARVYWCATRLAEYVDRTCRPSAQHLDAEYLHAKGALRNEGYQVVEARDGGEALQRVDERHPPPYCLVLLDISLPKLDGVAVLRHLAQQHT